MQSITLINGVAVDGNFSVAAQTSFFPFFDGAAPTGVPAIVVAVTGCNRERTCA